MNNAISEIKNTLEATNSRITEAEDRISELEDTMVEINESERIKEKRIKRNEDNLRDLQDNIKRYNLRIIGVPEEEDKKTSWPWSWRQCYAWCVHRGRGTVSHFRILFGTVGGAKLHF